MNETPLVNYTLDTTIDSDIQALDPIHGKIKTYEYKPADDAIYLEDGDHNVIAYVTYTPWFRSTEDVVVESYTNPALRGKGVQKKLNAELINTLREKGIKRLVGRIMLDNSSSLLNRLQMRDPSTGKVLKAEIVGLEEIEKLEVVKPHELWVNIDLNEVVENNNSLLDRIAKIQSRLVESHYGDKFFSVEGKY